MTMSSCATSASPSCSAPSSGSSSSASSGSASPNVPPADELHAVRAELKELKAREDELRRLMLSDPSARTGNRYVVEILDIATTRTDWTELRKMYPDIVSEYTFPATQQRVELRGISEDGEITSLRRRPA